MKTLLIMIFMLVFTVNIHADSYCLIECSGFNIIESYNENDIQSVASISKIMSAIIVLENSDINSFIVVNEEILKASGSSIYLKVGDVYSIRDLLYGLMLRSGNDAALILAYYVGNGSIEHFVELMNMKAKLLGLYNTKFNNPSGLDDINGNYSTTYEMSKIMCYALNYPILKEIMMTKTYKTSNNQIYINKNKLLNMNDYIVGGKTGYTKHAGRTLTSAFDYQNVLLANTTFRMYDDFDFHNKIYNKYKDNLKSYRLLTKGIYRINTKENDYQVKIDNDIYLILYEYDENKLKLMIENNKLNIKYNDDNFSYILKLDVRKL